MIKVKSLIGKEWDCVTSICWRTLLNLRTLNLQIPKVLSDLKKQSLQKRTYSAGVLPSPPTDTLCFLPLTEKINLSLSANNVMTFSEGDAKQKKSVSLKGQQ